MCCAAHFFLLFIILVFNSEVSVVNSCSAHSNSLHVCLHRYLEKDFTVIEQLIKVAPTDRRRGYGLLDNGIEMCSQIKTMRDCLHGHLTQCLTYPYFAHLQRVIFAMNGVIQVLCANGTQGIKELLNHGYCIEKVRLQESNSCVVNFSLPLTLARMIRLQEGNPVCDHLIQYNQCFVKKLIDRNCNEKASRVFNNSMNTWIESWCYGMYNSAAAAATVTLHTFNVHTFLSCFALFICVSKIKSFIF